MQIDIISDTVCPWCYIGKQRIEAALAELTDIDFDVRWRPFQLNPDMPAEGMDRKDYMAMRFGAANGGGKKNPVYQRLQAAAAEDGIALNFDKVGRMPNTLDSHRLMKWAAGANCENEMAEILFRRYFTDGEDISDHAVLIEAAKEAGMDGDLVADLLAGDSDKETIQQEDMMAREMGVSGVPSFLIDQKFLIPGAQDTQDIVRILTRMHEKAQKKAAEA
ncbi:MAG: DsbA family oxidoreductase [Alphaproteobacteria bacterium]